MLFLVIKKLVLLFIIRHHAFFLLRVAAFVVWNERVLRGLFTIQFWHCENTFPLLNLPTRKLQINSLHETRQLDDIAFLSQQPLGVNFEKKSCISYYEGEFIPVHACCQRMTTLSVLIRYQQHPCRLSKVIISKIPNESYIP